MFFSQWKFSCLKFYSCEKSVLSWWIMMRVLLVIIAAAIFIVAASYAIINGLVGAPF